MATPAPPAPSLATIPSPSAPVTDPLTSIETIPPPALAATIPPTEPLITWPVADWVRLTPPVPPVCVSVSAVP